MVELTATYGTSRQTVAVLIEPVPDVQVTGFAFDPMSVNRRHRVQEQLPVVRAVRTDITPHKQLHPGRLHDSSFRD